MSWLSVNVKTALGEQAESSYKEGGAGSNPASPTPLATPLGPLGGLSEPFLDESWRRSCHPGLDATEIRRDTLPGRSAS
jgi:hypothetical protein